MKNLLIILFLSSVTVMSKEINLTWDSTESGAIFIVEQRINNSKWVRIVKTKNTRISIKTNTSGVYFYRVITLVNGIESDPSNVVAVTNGPILNNTDTQ